MYKRMLLSGVAAGALLAGSANLTPAAAADVLAPQMLGYNWSGWYMGVHAGYGEASYDGGRELLQGDDDPPELAGDLDLSGFVGGIHLGFNHQLAPMASGHTVVWGIEGDFSAVYWDDTITQDDGSDVEGIFGDVDFLASVRARLGIANDHALYYATGGVAFTDASFGAFEIDGDGRSTVDLSDVGGVVGGGVEMISGQGHIFRVEGLYYFFDASESIDGVAGAGTGDFGAFDDAFVVRLGISVPLHGVN